MSTHDPIADSLLVHVTFVRRLAHALVGADGDDLAQETWAAALQAGPGDVHSARGWLATIAKNLARNLARGASRRQHREAAVAGSDTGVPDVAEIVAREEARRHVVDAVVALPEPLRSVVLLHFFEGLDSRAIGHRLGTPASTVRTQLQRALATLRQRLDRGHGDRRAAWALPLLAGTATAPGASPVLALDLLLRTSWPLRTAIGFAALALIGWLVVPLLNPPPVAPPTPPIEVAATDHAGENATPQPTPPAKRDAIAAAATAPSGARGPEDLWGRVIDAATAQPVAGAEVVLEHRDADEMTNLDLEHGKRIEVVGRTLSAADGGFAFRVRRALQHRIAVTAAGYAPLHAAMCTGGSEFVLRLERPATLTGTVRTADGRPLADVRVSVFVRNGTGERATTRSGPDGSFTLVDLPPRTSYVMAEPAGRVESDWREIALAPGATATAEIVIADGCTVRGTVRDAETGVPIAGARVATSWTMHPFVRTVADGSFELAGLGDRENLYVRATGYADQLQSVPSQAAGTTVDFALARGDTILGRIVGADGHGIADAYVAAGADAWSRNDGSVTFWRRGTIDEAGRFRIDCLSRADHAQPRSWQLLVRAPGMGTRVVALPFRRLVDGPLDVGDVRLAPQGMLEGRVVDGEGRPIAEAEVTLTGTPDHATTLTPELQEFTPIYHFWARRTRTAGNGTYRIAGIGAGSYSLRVEPPGVSWSLESGPHTVAAGAVFTVPDLVADAGLTITGRVRLAGGLDLPPGTRLTIRAFGPGSETRSGQVAPDGTFRIERLERGEFTLAALDAPTGYAILPRAGVAAGSGDVALALAVATTIEGQVVDEEGKSVRGATVYFFPQGVDTSRNTRTDAEGRFRIEVAPGVVGKLGANHPDEQWCQAHLPDVVAGSVGLKLTLQVPEGLRRK